MEQMTELLTELAQQLGTTVEYLWGVLIAQAQVYGMIGLILVTIGILLPIPYFFYLRYVLKNWDELESESIEFGHGIACVIFGGAIIGCFIGAITCFYSVYTALANPEFWALSEILDKL